METISLLTSLSTQFIYIKKKKKYQKEKKKHFLTFYTFFYVVNSHVYIYIEHLMFNFNSKNLYLKICFFKRISMIYMVHLGWCEAPCKLVIYHIKKPVKFRFGENYIYTIYWLMMSDNEDFTIYKNNFLLIFRIYF